MTRQEKPKKKPKKRSKPVLKKKVFPPAFVPTAEMRKDVEMMAAIGMPEKAMATLIKNPQTGTGIDLHTLRKHFHEEILSGAANAYRGILMNLFRMANKREANPVVLSAIEKFMRIVGKRFEDPEDTIDQSQKTEVTVNIDNRSQIAFTKEELFKLPVEDLRRLNEIRQNIPLGGESPL